MTLFNTDTDTKENKYSNKQDIKNPTLLSHIKNIHMVGIGGSGMSGIAEVLVKSGYNVSGSDLKKNLQTENLERYGIKVYYEHKAQNITDAQAVVLSSAVTKDNPEILEANRLNIPLLHRSDVLSYLMHLKQGIVIVGTHGKTTTSSMMASVFNQVGLDPTVVIGGKLNSLGSNGKFGKGEYFIAEGDESDGSFLKLRPKIAVITNIDNDHLDYYKSFDGIQNGFKTFVTGLPADSFVCACIDDPITQKIVEKPTITYGINSKADITATDISYQGLCTTFTPVILGKKMDPVQLPMPGSYNVSNALATFAVASLLKLNLQKIGQALSSFTGVDHRFTVLCQKNNITIVDDYAHNPKKIETVLSGVHQSFPEKKIIAVFQPHRHSRLQLQIDEFSRSFRYADKVVITPVFSAGEQNQSKVSMDDLTEAIKRYSFDGLANRVFAVHNFTEASELVLTMTKQIDSPQGALIITLGAGDVNKVGYLIMEKISFVS